MNPPKTGDNNDVIVLGFYVKDKEPSKGFMIKFIENGAYEILDVELVQQVTMTESSWYLLKLKGKKIFAN